MLRLNTIMRSIVTNETQYVEARTCTCWFNLRNTRISIVFAYCCGVHAAVSMRHSENIRSTNACETGALIKSWAIIISLLERILLFCSQNCSDSLPPMPPLIRQNQSSLHRHDYRWRLTQWHLPLLNFGYSCASCVLINSVVNIGAMASCAQGVELIDVPHIWHFCSHKFESLECRFLSFKF